MTERKHRPGTFAFAPAALAMDPDLGKPALRVGLLMARHANEKGECWLSTETMARVLQIPRSSVIEGCRQLVARGHAHREAKPGRSSVYILQFRSPDEIDYPPPAAPDGAGQDVASPSPTVPAEPAQPDRQNRSPPDRQNRSGDGEYLTGISSPPDRIQPPHLTGRTGHDHNKNEIRDHEEEEDARAREAAAALPAALSFEDQAALIWDAMAGRTGLPGVGMLIADEREALGKRLQQLNGLDGWQRLIEKIERSKFLTSGGKPWVKFRWFLIERNCAATARGDYDAERDPPARGFDAEVAGISAAGRQDPATSEAPAFELDAQPTPPSPPDPLETNLGVIAQYCGRSRSEMEAQAARWQADLEAGGFDPQTARQVLTDEAKRVPKTYRAIEGMNERITARLKAKAA